MPGIITDLEAVQALADAHADDFEVLKHQLQLIDHIDDAHLDAWVESIAAPIMAAIDCTQCGNCCRSLHVYLTPEDAEMLADGLGTSAQAVTDQLVDRESAQRVDEWGMMRTQPCPLLNGKLCTVYDHRPQTCRTYPALTPDFRWVMDFLIGGTHLCPIITNTLCAVMERVNELYADER